MTTPATPDQPTSGAGECDEQEQRCPHWRIWPGLIDVQCTRQSGHPRDPSKKSHINGPEAWNDAAGEWRNPPATPAVSGDEVEALAWVIVRAPMEPGVERGAQVRIDPLSTAAHLLASDWFAQRLATAKAEGAREVRERVEDAGANIGIYKKAQAAIADLDRAGIDVGSVGMILSDLRHDVQQMYRAALRSEGSGHPPARRTGGAE